ncbi:MAG: YciI family protein [Candidatus Heimdallarchaeota archaeon]
MSKSEHYIGIIKPTRDGFMTSPTDEEIKAMKEHFEYLKNLLSEDKLVLAGPATNIDNPFGILIFKVESREEAEKMLKNDPSIKAGVQSIKEFEPFNLSLIKTSK